MPTTMTNKELAEAARRERNVECARDAARALDNAVWAGEHGDHHSAIELTLLADDLIRQWRFRE